MVAFACNVDWGGNEYIEPMLKLFEDNNIKISFSLLENGRKKILSY